MKLLHQHTRPLTRARLRGGAILAALRNHKAVDLRVDPKAACADVPNGGTRLRLALNMYPPPDLRVSGLGLHATIERAGKRHRVRLPWHAIVEWRAS